MITVNDEAFKVDSGPTLLLAGPGTGKTYQIARRIQYLTSGKNIFPDGITVITFTTEAAASMRNKITEEDQNILRQIKDQDVFQRCTVLVLQLFQRILLLWDYDLISMLLTIKSLEKY